MAADKRPQPEDDVSDLAPVQEEGRIESLDVMRGFAVLGILIVNAAFFAAPWQSSQNPMLPPLAVTEATLWSWYGMHVLFEYKCITLFSLLFGASICLVGGDTNDRARSALLTRRLLWLLVFGIIHGALIWYGDVLVVYALTGFLVMRLRSWPPIRQLVFGVGVLAFSIGASALLAWSFDHLTWDQIIGIKQAIWAPTPADVARIEAAYRGGFVSALAENFSTWIEYVSGAAGIIVRTAGVMLIGMGLLRSGFLAGRAPLFVYWLALGAGAIAFALIGWQAWLNWLARFDFMHMQTRGHFANTALSIFCSLFYAALFILLVKARVRFVTRPLAAVGRMAFTNYLTQSLIMTTIFWSGRGFGLYGEVDRPTLMGIVAAVWVLQLVWSPLWLARFRMGPLEWAWRRLSYGKPIAMAKGAPA